MSSAPTRPSPAPRQSDGQPVRVVAKEGREEIHDLAVRDHVLHRLADEIVWQLQRLETTAARHARTLVRGPKLAKISQAVYGMGAVS